MTLSDRAYNYYRRVILEEISPKLVGTNMVAQGENLPPGTRKVTSEELKRLRGRSKVGEPGTPIPRETGEIERATVYLPEISHGFRLHRKDLEASKNFGEPLPSLNARQSAQMVREGIEELIFLGNSTLGIKGIYADAGNTYEVEDGKEWNEDDAQIVNDVIRMFAALPAKYADMPKKMALSYNAYMMLFKVNDMNIAAIDTIEKLFPNGRADIYVAPETIYGEDEEVTVIPEDGGVLGVFGNIVAERWVEEEVNLREMPSNEDDVIPYNIVTYQTVDIHDVNAFVKLENLIAPEE